MFAIVVASYDKREFNEIVHHSCVNTKKNPIILAEHLNSDDTLGE